MKYRVEVEPAAAEAIERRFRKLLEEAPVQAVKWFERVETALRSLANNPERCPRAPEDTLFDEEIRHRLIGKKPHVYHVLFTVREDIVQVLYFRGPRQDVLRSSRK